MLTKILENQKVQEVLITGASALVVYLSTQIGRLIEKGIELAKANIKQKHNFIYAAVATRLVSYAEQALKDNLNTDKAAYVTAELTKQFPNLPADQIQHLMEEAVLNVKAGLTTPITSTPDAPATVTSGQ